MKIEIKMDSSCPEPKIIIVAASMTGEVQELVNRLSEMSPQVLSGIRVRFMYAQVSEVLRRDILSALEECGGGLPAGVEEGILYDLRFLAHRPG